MSEYKPRIIAGADLGRWFSDVDVDTEALSEYATLQGISTNSVEVHIKAENTLYTTPDGEQRTINGLYYAKSGVIALYLCRIAYDYERNLNYIQQHTSPDEVRDQFSQYWSKLYSRILKHELIHKKHRIARGGEGQHPHPSLNAFELARIAMSQSNYANDSEEAECNAQAAVGPENIVRVRIRDLERIT